MKNFFVKIFLLVTFVLAGIFNFAEAEEVTVEGVGVNRDDALRNARRVAVEQVIGTFVDARTLTKNNILELDRVYTKTSGFIGNVNVLSEGMDGEFYKVRAKINVASNPSSEILQQIQAVVALNDPKIAVCVFKENSAIHEDAIESAIIDKLVSVKFNHIVDSKLATGLQNSQTLTALESGRAVKNLGAEFIVLGRCFTTSKSIKIPDFKGGYIETGLDNGTTQMVTKIIKADTGEVLETFTVETSGLGVGDESARREAVKNMAGQAADKVEEKFRRIGAKADFQ